MAAFIPGASPPLVNRPICFTLYLTVDYIEQKERKLTHISISAQISILAQPLIKDKATAIAATAYTDYIRA